MGLLGGETPRETAIAWGFVLVQGALILAVLLLPAGDAWVLSPAADAIAVALEWVGAVILVVGLVNLGRSLTALPTPVPHGELKVGGLYRFVRHPIYTGVMALVLGAAARSGNPWSAGAAVALVGWFMAKARWEEDRLRARYPDYDDYAARTPRFVPGWPLGADRRR
ncbi:MAG TPA: isoprenylcysteine carboxylmethyltransferase family protein [Acidimicrobiales bacterium]|nr:isoprenylcysteine carboxylmethyltransferase family protein [Acidimicrobiales bacterium]